jgi:DNA-binding transcriptional MerR regulator
MKRITIGALASAAGTRITTIRYYERAGLLPAPDRTGCAHRVYTSEQVTRLLFIRRARELGFSIAEIRMLLHFADAERTPCREVQQFAAAHLDRIQRKITVLVQLRNTLARTVAQCSGQPDAPCAVLDWLKLPAEASERSVDRLTAPVAGQPKTARARKAAPRTVG